MNNKKLKISFVCQTIYPLLNDIHTKELIGGAELQQLLIGKELLKRGYDISYITMDQRNRIDKNRTLFKIFFTFKPDEGISYIRFFYPRLIKIWKALERADADVYYVRTASFILALVVLFCQLKNKKVVYCGANDPEFDPKRLKSRISFRDRLMFFWGLKRCNIVVVQNKIQQKLLYKNFKKIGHLVYNSFFDFKKQERQKKYNLWVATFKDFKRPELFLEIAKSLPEEKFVMVGRKANYKAKNNQNLFDYAKNEARKIKNLKFEGTLNLIEVEKLFAKSKLFINTSRHEGFPNTFLQAWSKGIPVVSFVDPDNLIKEHNLGLVANDVHDMIAKIRCVHNKEITFSESDIKLIYRKKFAIKKIIDDYEKIFLSQI